MLTSGCMVNGLGESVVALAQELAGTDVAGCDVNRWLPAGDDPDQLVTLAAGARQLRALAAALDVAAGSAARTAGVSAAQLSVALGISDRNVRARYSRSPVQEPVGVAGAHGLSGVRLVDVVSGMLNANSDSPADLGFTVDAVARQRNRLVTIQGLDQARVELHFMRSRRGRESWIHDDTAIYTDPFRAVKAARDYLRP